MAARAASFDFMALTAQLTYVEPIPVDPAVDLAVDFDLAQLAAAAVSGSLPPGGASTFRWVNAGDPEARMRAAALHRFAFDRQRKMLGAANQPPSIRLAPILVALFSMSN